MPPPPPLLASVYRIWRLGIRDAWVKVPLLPHHCLVASHQGLRLYRAGPTSHGGDNSNLIQTLPESQGLGGVQVLMLHKVTQDLLVLGREAGSQMWFLPGGIEQRVPGLPRPHLLTQRPERRLIRQDAAPPPVDVQNGRFVRTNNGHHVTGSAITLHLADLVRAWCDVNAVNICPLHVPSMDEIPIGQIIVAPNFHLSNPFYYEDHVAILVLLLPLFPLKPHLPQGTLLPCPPPGSGTLMDGVHQGCLLDIRIAIGPTGGESLGWVRVDVVVHVGKGFSKGPGLVFGLRRALACALWGGLAFALWRGLAFALWGGLAFALWRGLAFAFALRMALPFALVWAFALRRAIPFALLWAFALLRAFALPRAMGLCLPSVWHVVRVGALWPGTEGKLLRLSGLQ